MSTCPICLESNNTMFYLPCTHGFCNSCVSRLSRDNIELPSCPICRSGNNINYSTFFPNTEEYSPHDLVNWNNSEFNAGKGESQEMTNYERAWLDHNIGIVGNSKDKDELIQDRDYIILIQERYFFGKYISKNRDNQDEYIFKDVRTLQRKYGTIFNCSPTIRNLNLSSDEINLYEII